MKFLKYDMSWYNVTSHDSSYYFNIYATEIKKFPCQLQYNELSLDRSKIDMTSLWDGLVSLGSFGTCSRGQGNLKLKFKTIFFST